MKKIALTLLAVIMLTNVSYAGFLWPVSGRAGGDWGDPRDGGSRIHKGVDVYNSIGTPIYNSQAGTISYAAYGYNGGYGNVVYMNHSSGYSTRYAHLRSIYVRRGTRIAKANYKRIAALGRSAINYSPAHLHFEILRYGTKKPIYVKRGIWLRRGTRVPGW